MTLIPKYLILKTASDLDDNVDWGNAEFMGTFDDRNKAERRAELLSGVYYNRNMHLFELKLIGEAIGGGSFERVQVVRRPGIDYPDEESGNEFR